MIFPIAHLLRHLRNDDRPPVVTPLTAEQRATLDTRIDEIVAKRKLTDICDVMDVEHDEEKKIRNGS